MLAQWHVVDGVALREEHRPSMVVRIGIGNAAEGGHREGGAAHKKRAEHRHRWKG